MTPSFETDYAEAFCPETIIPFEQALDRKRPFELLTRNPPFSGRLHYRYTDTGAEVEVPNIWYNQTLWIQLRAAQWRAEELRKTIIQFQKNPPAGYTPQIVRGIIGNHERTLEGMRREILELEKRVDAGER